MKKYKDVRIELHELTLKQATISEYVCQLLINYSSDMCFYKKNFDMVGTRTGTIKHLFITNSSEDGFSEGFMKFIDNN